MTSSYVVLLLVLLPAAMYGVALLLNLGRTWLGFTGLPKARRAVASRVGALRRTAAKSRPRSRAC